MNPTDSLTSADPQPGSAAEKIAFRGLYGALVTVALAFFGYDYADPNDYKWVVVLTLSCVSAIWIAARAFMQERLAPDALDLSLLGLLAYTALSLLWSPDPTNGWAVLGKATMLALIFFAVRHFADEALLRVIGWAAAAAVLLALVFDVLKMGSYAGFGNPNFATEFFLHALPFVVALGFWYRHAALRALAGLVAAAALVYLFGFNVSKIEFLVLPGVAILATGAYFWRRARLAVVVVTLLIAAAVASVVAYKWETGHGFRESIYSRVGLNVNTALMWIDAPLFGHGAGSFSVLYPSYQSRHQALIEDKGTELFQRKALSAGAAHNEFLQLLSTFGLAGFGLALAVGYFLLRGIARHGTSITVWTGLAVTAVWMLNALVEFPWQNPATALLATLGLAFAARAANAEPPLRTLPLPHAAGLLLIALALVGSGLAVWTAQRFREANRNYIDVIRYLNVEPARSHMHNQEAIRLYPPDTNMRVQSFVTMVRWMEMNKNKAPLPPDESDRLFERAISAGPTNTIVLARVQYLINSGRMKERAGELDRWFEHLRRNAPNTPDVWVLDTYYGLLRADPEHAARALARAEKIVVAEHHKALLASFRETLAKLRNAVASGATVSAAPAPAQ